MGLDRQTKALLRKALTIPNSQVPTYRALDVLATPDGDVSEIAARYHDIKDSALRTAFHYCAQLLRELARQEGLLPNWEIAPDDELGSRSSASSPSGESGAARVTSSGTQRKAPAENLRPFVDRSVRGQVRVAKAYVDGASRGNPGAAGIGIALFAMDGREIARVAKPIGEATNNVAEYSALLEALRLALELGIEELHVLSDSELMVRQMNGQYKIRNAQLAAFARQAQELARRFRKFSIDYVSREHNKLADALSNYALDHAEPGKTNQDGGGEASSNTGNGTC